MEYQRGQLKQEVKAAMKGTSPRPMLVTLVFVLLVGVGNWLLSFVINLVGTTWGDVSAVVVEDIMEGADPEQAVEWVMYSLMQSPGVLAAIGVTSVILSILTYLWNSLMTVGYEGYCLSMTRRENPPLQRIFCAFPQTGWVLLTRVLTGVFLFLWTLLFAVGFVLVVVIGALLMEDLAALGVILILAGYVAFVVGVIWASLRYAMVDFILLDTGVSGLDAIRLSKELMRGNKGRYFVLCLSFIGWYLLETAIMLVGVIIAALIVTAVTLGTGSSNIFPSGGMVAGVLIAFVIVIAAVVLMIVFDLWLKPYVTGASARFYDWLKGQRPDALPSGGGDSFTYTDNSSGSQDPWNGGWGNGQ